MRAGEPVRAWPAALTGARLAAWLAAVGTAIGIGAGLATAAEPGNGSAWSAERLYRDGVTADGHALVGARPGGTSLVGAAAACATCHRRSGLGTAEGRSVIPPITGEFLFQPRNTHLVQADHGNAVVADSAAGVTGARKAYDDATLARALREGIGSDGQALSVLMPRYALGDDETAALVSYLRSLGSGAVAGVGDDTLHFATIVTPDADPVARERVLSTLEQFFHDRNHIIAGQARPMAHNEKGVLYRVTRKWELHVWQLEGQPGSWEDQLQRFWRQQPVFAVVSGQGGSEWRPVQRFCESQHLPCLFPNADAPADQDDNFYSVYFSRGVFLEADLIRAGMAGQPGGVPPRVVQVVRAGTAGEAGAARLAAWLAGQGSEVEVRRLQHDDDAAALERAVRGGAGTALVLWLAAADLPRLPPAPPDGVQVWLSGLSAGEDVVMPPPAWRERSEMAYPYELPERRALALTLPQGWFRIKHIELTRPRQQLQAYLACQILSEMVGEMHVALVPDYLIERTEVMLSHRQFNALYPRLSLGAGQRYASKGGYLVRLGETGRLLPDGDWRIP